MQKTINDEALILQGGKPWDIEFVLKSDMDILTKRSIYISERRKSIPSFLVSPQLNIEEGLSAGKYKRVQDGVHNFIKGIVNTRPTPKEIPKTVYLVTFEENDYWKKNLSKAKMESKELLKEYKLKLLDNPIPFLLRLMEYDTNKEVTEACRAFQAKWLGSFGDVSFFAKLNVNDLEGVGVDEYKEIANYMIFWPDLKEKFYLAEDFV